MKRSIRLAAKAHNIAIVVLLVCATSLGTLALIRSVFPPTERMTGDLAGLFFTLLGVAFAIMIATGFHIAVADALGRIERREKNSTSDEGV
jgi:protein-S-isoprenylcysteine O-methyltransferase Ste14